MRREEFECAVWQDEWVTQPIRQGDAKVFKKYSQMKLQMKREAYRFSKTNNFWVP
jgi:hypothetical protein